MAKQRKTPNQIEVKCSQCGSPVYLYPSQVKPMNYCDRLCLGKYRTEHLSGARSAGWKGGITVSRDRVYVHLPWHLRADGDGYVARSVIVAELKLRRPIAPEEVVHHEDEDPSNDHPDNLTVYPSQAEHARHHMTKRHQERRNAHG